MSRRLLIVVSSLTGIVTLLALRARRRTGFTVGALGVVDCSCDLSDLGSEVTEGTSKAIVELAERGLRCDDDRICLRLL